MTGFASSALSSIASSVWQGGKSYRYFESLDVYKEVTVHNGIDAGTGAIGTLAFGTIMGGAGSALTGGNFWQGTVTGLMVSGLNHCFHNDNPNKRLQSKYNRELKKAFGKRLDLKFSPTPSGMNGGAHESDIKTVMNIDTIKSLSSKSGNPSAEYKGFSSRIDGQYVVGFANELQKQLKLIRLVVKYIFMMAVC